MSVQFSLVQSLSRVRLCDPMDCTTPGLPVHHPLPESTQTHVHWVDDAIQPSHPLSSPSPPAFNVSQHQGLSVSRNHVGHYWQGSFQMSQLFVSGSQSIGVLASASVLPMNIQDWFPLGLTGWISLYTFTFTFHCRRRAIKSRMIPWKKERERAWDFHEGPVVKTPRCQCREWGFNSWLVNQDPTFHVVWPKG